MILQCLRRAVQAAVVLIMVAVAFLSLYAHYRSAKVIDDETLLKGLKGAAMAQWMHPMIDRLEQPEKLLDGNKGTIWSMRILGVSVTDPLALVEAAAASRHVHWPLLLSALAPIAITVILGRVFCSWICPGYVLFELAGKLRRLLRFAEIQPGEVKFSYLNKYIFLVIGVVVAAITAAPLFALVYPPAVISRAVHAWIFGTELLGMLVLLGVLVAFEVLVSPRWWCRSMCPGGALYGVLGALRLVRVKLRRDACTGCKACIPVCEAGINPITQSESIECDNCGVCIRHCGDDALGFRVVLPVLPSGRRPVRSVTPAVPPLLLLGALLLAPALQAHHILGLPHYSYKENYPQRPTLEYPATTGPYDVLFTSYPGVPRAGEPANLAFYVKNRVTSEVYSQPITARILQTSTFGDNLVIMPFTSRPPFDNQHKFHATFPEDGEYIVELSLEVEGRVEVIPFLIFAGQPRATASIVVAAVTATVLTLIAVRAVQVKRRRRRQAAVVGGSS